MKKWSLPILLILLVLSATHFPNTVNARRPIKLGWVGPITGPFSAVGLPAKESVLLAVDDINRRGGINGQPLEIVLMDSQFSVVRAIETIQRLIYVEKVKAIIGGLTSAATLASMEMVTKERIPLLAYGATALETKQIKSPFVLRISGSESDLTKAITDYAIKSLHLRKFAVLSPDNRVGNIRRTIFEKHLSKIGEGRIVLTEMYPTFSTDFMPYLHKIRAVNPDAIVLTGFTHDSALITKQAKQIGIKAQMLGSGLAQSERIFWQMAGTMADGLLTPTFYCPKVYKYNKAVEFVERWKRMRKEEPGYVAANAYDTVMLLAEAMRNVGTDGERIVNALKIPREYKGVSGIMKFLPSGEIKKSIIIVVWEKGRLSPREIYY